MIRMRAPALLLALAPACHQESPYCADEVTELSSLDEVSASGLRGADVLGPAEGLHTATMSYHGPERQAVFVDVDPPEPTTEIEVEVRFDDGGVRYIDSEAVYPKDSRTPIALICSSRLEVDAELTLRSADGLLDEHWPVILSDLSDDDTASDRTRLHVDVDLDMLAGSLEVVAIDPEDPDDLRVFLEIEFPWGAPEAESPPAMIGSLRGLAEYERRDVVEAGFFTIASW